MSLYDFGKGASEYDNYYLTEFGNQVDELEKTCVESFLNRLSNKNILEIGSGTGHWTEFLVEKGFYIRCIEYSEQMLKIALNKSIPNVDFALGDVHYLKFHSDSIDNIVSITCLEFVEDRDKAFREIFRVLKPGGCLLVGVLNIESVLGKSKQDSEVFRNANFYRKSDLSEILSKIGKPEIAECARLNEDNSFTDDENIPGLLLVGFVRKECK